MKMLKGPGTVHAGHISYDPYDPERMIEKLPEDVKTVAYTFFHDGLIWAKIVPWDEPVYGYECESNCYLIQVDYDSLWEYLIKLGVASSYEDRTKLPICDNHEGINEAYKELEKHALRARALGKNIADGYSELKDRLLLLIVGTMFYKGRYAWNNCFPVIFKLEDGEITIL